MSHISIKDKRRLFLSSRENVHNILRKEKILQNSVYAIRFISREGELCMGIVHIYICVRACTFKTFGKCHRIDDHGYLG